MLNPLKVLSPIARWFDTTTEYTPDALENPYKIDWFRSLPFFAMHAMCLGVFFVGWSWVAVGTAFALYWIRMFAITGFYHRYFSHRTFKTNRFWQFIFGAWGSSATQKGPLWWAAHHRHHHRHSDEPDDIHSPIEHGFFWSHVGWITCKGNFPTNYKAIPDLAKYPELMLINRFDTAVPVMLAVGLFFLGKGLQVWAPQLGTTGPQMLIWGFFVSTVVLFHGTCTINSLAHLIGRRRFATKDESRNSFWLSIITMGEGWHNNHHHYPATVRQGFFWWELDVTYYILKMFSWMGIIWDLNPVNEAAIKRRRIDIRRKKIRQIRESRPSIPQVIETLIHPAPTQ